jgi:uncharacterized protein (DUF433 family)
MALLESYVAQPPLYETEGGAIRVQGTRVSLDTVISYFNQGYTAEDIVRSFDTLKLRDVYVTIVFYLDNRDAVDTYIKRREAEAAKLRLEIEALYPPGQSLQAKLAARKAEKEGA